MSERNNLAGSLERSESRANPSSTECWTSRPRVVESGAADELGRVCVTRATTNNNTSYTYSSTWV